MGGRGSHYTGGFGGFSSSLGLRGQSRKKGSVEANIAELEREMGMKFKKAPTLVYRNTRRGPYTDVVTIGKRVTGAHIYIPRWWFGHRVMRDVAFLTLRHEMRENLAIQNGKGQPWGHQYAVKRERHDLGRTRRAGRRVYRNMRYGVQTRSARLWTRMKYRDWRL